MRTIPKLRAPAEKKGFLSSFLAKASMTRQDLASLRRSGPRKELSKGPRPLSPCSACRIVVCTSSRSRRTVPARHIACQVAGDVGRLLLYNLLQTRSEFCRRRTCLPGATPCPGSLVGVSWAPWKSILPRRWFDTSAAAVPICHGAFTVPSVRCTPVRPACELSRSDAS